ncbi:unnamed protein product, partial [Arabidopsis halleri]
MAAMSRVLLSLSISLEMYLPHHSFGVLQDYVNNWRVTSLVLTFVFFPAAAI